MPTEKHIERDHFRCAAHAALTEARKMCALADAYEESAEQYVKAARVAAKAARAASDAAKATRHALADMDRWAGHVTGRFLGASA